jgi:hypothetical protein
MCDEMGLLSQFSIAIAGANCSVTLLISRTLKFANHRPDVVKFRPEDNFVICQIRSCSPASGVESLGESAVLIEIKTILRIGNGFSQNGEMRFESLPKEINLEFAF